MTLFTPASYDSLTAMREASILEAHSDTPVVHVPQYEIDLIDVCNSQYFRGTHKLCFQLFVTGSTTYQELMVDMLDWQNTDHIENLDWEAYQTAVDDFFSVIKCDMSEKAFPYLDIPQTDAEAEEWDCYAFFAIEPIGEDDE